MEIKLEGDDRKILLGQGQGILPDNKKLSRNMLKIKPHVQHGISTICK